MGEQQQQQDAKAGPVYGANLTTGQFIVVVIALALGTILEWYDFFVYSMLNSTLSKVFFPSTNPTVQQVSFWGVFFVGFVARPIGSVIFGHIGDTRGRRLTLLLSIVIMAVPSVLIGCLPTYAQAGIAAPVLLSLLRLVQGLAMGGEFGSALVYLHEIASQKRKGFTGSIGFASAISGCMLGVLVVLILESALTTQQMLVFGWRLPFLATIISASAALALRLHMPEPHEFVQEQQVLQDTHDPAAVLSVASMKHNCSSSLKQQQQHIQAASFAASDSDVESGVQLQKQTQLDVATEGKQQPQGGPITTATTITASTARQPGCCGSLPIAMLLRWHWAAVLLQFLFEAWVSCSFYTLTTWLPLHMHTALGVPLNLTRGMLIVNLLVCVVTQLAAGHASDMGLPRLWSAISVYIIGGAIVGPIMLYGMQPNNVAAAWLQQALLLALVGWVLGIIPATCSPIYPPSVRTTGFNLGHNMSMSWLGGLSPTIVTALASATSNQFMAPTVLLVAAAGLSLIASLALLWYAPEANKRPVDAEVVVS